MTVNSTTLGRVLSAVALLLCGCQDRASSETESDASTGTPTSSSGTTAVVATSTTDAPATTEPDDGSSSAADTEVNSSEADDGGAQCDIYGQDCIEGDKCTPYSDQPDLRPDDIRCCPIVGDSPRQPGDSCVVEDYFGSCLDDCDVGSFCLDIDNDGDGTCQAFCGGTVNNPQCELDETCFIYFEGTPLCFDKCDPLAQACPDDQGCYPDAKADGGTGFICLPSIGPDNTYGDYCWLLSNCSPGFICVTPEFQPECDGLVGCCTPLCDTAEPDDCSSFDPNLECVSWYQNGQTPPSAALEEVGDRKSVV